MKKVELFAYAFFLISVVHVATSSKAQETTPNLITIQNLNVDSTIQDIEAVLGDCVDSADEFGLYLCGASAWTGYSLNEAQQLDTIMFECAVIDSCSYVPQRLFSLLVENFALKDIEDFSAYGLTFMRARGAAGDALTVLAFDNTTVIGVARFEYGLPALKLR